MRSNAYFKLLATLGLALVATLVLLLALNAGPARAATRTVCTVGCDHTSIQAAVDAANDGDIILVANETFNESIIITKSVTLLGGYTGLPGDTSSRTPRSTYVGTVPGRVIEIQGAGIAVTIDGFEIANGTIVGGNGGGIYVDVEDDSVVTIHDNLLHDNSADDGGGIYADVDNRSDLHITGNDVMSNTTSDDYAGIYADVYLSGTLTLTGNNIVGNTSGDYGGGLYAYVGSLSQFQIEDNLVMSNTTAIDGDPLSPQRYYGGLYFEAQYNSHGTFDRNQVIGNTADDYYGGGYVYISYNSSATFYDNAFRGNTTNYRDYGGLYLYVYGNSHVSGDNLALADNTVNGGSYDYGGGYVEAYYNSTIDLPNTRVTGNRASGDYGGAYFYAYDHCTIRVPDLYVYDNVAGGSYGGVYLDASDGNDIIVATNAQVISNTAQSGNGGGAYAYADDGSLVDLSDSRFISNTAGSDGGGLYVDDICEGSRMLLGQTEFLTNTAGSDGGGIYFEYGPNYGAYLDLSGSRFISNTAQSGDGGGFYIEYVYYNDPTAVSIQADHMTFERNTAGDEGGGFYFYEAYEGTGQMIFDDSVYRENTAGSDGGGVYWEYCYEGCDLSMSRNVFEDNEATSSDGGGVYFYEAYYGAEVHFDDNEFLDNIAGDQGGGFYNDYFAYEGSLGTFDRNVLRGNTAGGAGGGFYSFDFGYEGADVSFSDNVVVGNTSDGEGGGVYMYYPAYEGVTLAFNRNVISGNLTTGGDGGGLYMEYIEYGARAEFKDNVISHNVISSTSSYNGGGIYLYTIDEGSIVWMTGNQINDNIATGDGGGLYMDDYIDYGSVWYFYDNELQRNWAGDDGGGCYFDDYWYDGSVVHFNRNLVNDNTTLGDYGGCYFYDIEYAEVDLIGNQFNRNTAGGDYGGLYFESVEYGAVMRFWANQIIGNRAGISETVLISNQVVYTDAVILGGDYGGLYLEDIKYGGEVDFRRNQILSNTAYLTGTTGGDYGGMYTYLSNAGLLTMMDNVITGNEAQGNFGGLSAELYSGSRLVMAHNLISANTAITNGAGIYIKGDDDSQYFLERNRVLNNTAAYQSAGVIIDNDDLTEPLWGWSVNNLVADNSGGSQLEAGIYVDSADFRSLNDTIANNGQYGIWMTGTLTSTAYVSNTIIWDHILSFDSAHPTTQTMEADYSDIQLTLGNWPGMANLNTDPLFLGGDDYHLQGTSPVMDQADAAVAPARDLDAIPRPVGAGVDMGCYEYHLSGVTLTGDGLLSGDPGTWVTHTLTLTNDGDAEDAFALSLSGNTWPAHLPADHVILAAGADTTVVVAVRVPAGASAGESDTVTVDAVSTRNALVVDSASVDTEASLVPDVDVTPDHAAEANVGRAQVYHHTVENLGNGAETFDLSVSSSLGWAVQVAPSSVTLGEGLSTTVKVQVTVPGDAIGQMDITTLTATARSDGSVSDSATDTSTAVNNANLTLAPNRTAAALLGTAQTYTHTLTNHADAADTIHLSASSDQGWAVNVDPASVTLDPDASATVYVTVTAPGSGANGMLDLTQVTATSDNDPGVTDHANDVMLLLNPASVVLTTNQAQTAAQGEMAVYTHTLTNEGAQIDTFSLSASSDQGWTTQLSPAAVTLNPGESAQVVLHVQVPADAAPDTLDATTLTATSAYGAAAYASNVDTTTATQAGYSIFLPLVHRNYSAP